MPPTPWWKHKLARKTAKVGAEVAKLAVHLNSSTSMLGKTSVLLGAAGALIGEEDPLMTEMAFLSKIDAVGLTNEVTLNVLIEKGRAFPGRSRGHEVEYILKDEHSSLRVFWVSTARDHNTYPKGPWCQGGTPEQAEALIGRVLWECLGPSAELVLTSDNTSSLRPSPLSSHAPSYIAEKTHADTVVHNSQGRNRVILLYGPPGTGKSYAARHVAHLRGEFTLRHQPTHWSRSTLSPLMRFMRPKTLIIEDIDRNVANNLLHLIEESRTLCPLTIITANYPELLDPAMRRPGRFDEIIRIETLDPSVILKMIPDADEDTKQRVLALPVAYVEEYRTCLEAFGPKRAANRLKELETLAADLKQAKPQPNPFGPQTAQ